MIHKEGRQHTDQEITARRKREIHVRLIIDSITTTKIQRNKNFTKLIDASWKKGSRETGNPAPL